MTTITNTIDTIDNTDTLAKLALDLYHNQIVQFGKFTLRSGQSSEIYFDLRRLISNPQLLSSIVQQYISLYSSLKPSHIDTAFNGTQLICGVPYTGIPMATIYSQLTGMGMIMLRKEKKEYGTKKMIEGNHQANDEVILLDDVISTGGSLVETIKELENGGLKVAQILVLIDRRPIKERTTHLSDNKYPIKAVFQMEALLEFLVKQGINVPPKLLSNRKNTWLDRLSNVTNRVSKKLLSIIDSKKTNLVLSADVNTMDELLRLADMVGPEICILKTHVDMLQDFHYDILIPQLRQLSYKHNFLILEDRKFADIGNTVQQQYSSGIYHINAWADIVTCHTIMGEGIIKAFQDEISHLNEDRAILLLAQLSNDGNLITSEYTKRSCELALKYPNIVMGLICQEKLIYDNRMLHLTPGVNLAKGTDKKDQMYNTPEYVINQAESDLIIVGRGIYTSEDPIKIAKEYKEQAWNAYLTRIS